MLLSSRLDEYKYLIPIMFMNRKISFRKPYRERKIMGWKLNVFRVIYNLLIAAFM